MCVCVRVCGCACMCECGVCGVNMRHVVHLVEYAVAALLGVLVQGTLRGSGRRYAPRCDLSRKSGELLPLTVGRGIDGRAARTRARPLRSFPQVRGELLASSRWPRRSHPSAPIVPSVPASRICGIRYCEWCACACVRVYGVNVCVWCECHVVHLVEHPGCNRCSG